MTGLYYVLLLIFCFASAMGKIRAQNQTETHCSDCHINAICEDMNSVHKCICKRGFAGDGLSCVDVDECAHTSSNTCGSAMCVNTFGSYTCKCPAGYIENPSGSGCEDINECDSYPCSPLSSCVNIPGNYSCIYESGSHHEVNQRKKRATANFGLDCVDAFGSSVCMDPCFNYTVLNEYWRSINVTYLQIGYANCDNTKRGWYRFVGSGGTQMPEYCILEYSCGTHAPMWINGSHPSISDGIVNRTSCARWSGSCCLWSTTIKIKACSGGYYVYKLDGTPVCSLTYCTDPSAAANPCSTLACGDDEECKNLNGTWGCYCKYDNSSSLISDIVKLTPEVMCSPSQMKVSFRKCYLESMGYVTANVTLRDRTCAGFRDINRNNKSTISLVTAARTGYCSTQLTKNATHAVYGNVVYLPSRSTVTDVIVRDKDTYVSYSCTYPLDMQISLSSSLNPIISSTNISVGGTATYTLKMALYQYPNFTLPYEGPSISLGRDAMLYVGLLVDDAERSQFILLMRNCYGTPTRDPAHPVKYFIIKNSCPNKQDATISVIENGVSLQGKWQLQIFKFFGDYPQVYFHCEVVLCDPSAGLCAPNCNNARASKTQDIGNSTIISFGPVLTNDNTAKLSGSGIRGLGILPLLTYGLALLLCLLQT
ncbi:uromodulin-like [Protopterus annectens]|uniref:uromodulin-like n=1 Tax=Protopterus annectens TaxID=7888 RepID=UPI001CFA1831|nr:uromodulin-like [Protopterus annectens]